MIVAAMEPRAATGEYDAASGKWTLHSSSQGVFGMKTTLMDILGAPADKVRVLTGQVGGSFGMKAAVYPEYICILHGAKELGRPVKWTDERSGSFVSDQHGRAQDMTIEIAFDDKAHITALRLTGYGDMGGYLSSVRAAAVDRQPGQEHRVGLPHAADRGGDQMRVHHHHARVGLSRRRPPGRQLLRRARARRRRRRDGHRPARTAQAQHDPQERPAVQGRLRHDLRLRRFPRRAQAGAGDGRLCRLQEAQAREQEARASCAASASAAISKSPPAAARNWATSTSRPTAR